MTAEAYSSALLSQACCNRLHEPAPWRMRCSPTVCAFLPQPGQARVRAGALAVLSALAYTASGAAPTSARRRPVHRVSTSRADRFAK